MTGVIPEQLDEFVHELYKPATDGCALLWAAVDKTSIWVDLADPASFAPALAQVRHLVGKSDLYYGVCTRTANLGEWQRGGDKDCHQRFALVGDLDVEGPGHSKTGLFPSIDAARQTLAKIPIPPTFIIDSGGGAQAGWCLAEPEDAQDPKIVELQRRLVATLRRHAGPYAGGVDNVSDAARIMRLGGTYNLKVAGCPRPVELLEKNWDRRYNPSDLDDALDELDDNTKRGSYTTRDAAPFTLTHGQPDPTVQFVLDQAVAACAGTQGSRHETVWPLIKTLARYAERGRPGVQTAINQLRPVFVNAVAPDRAGGADEAEDEFDRMVRDAMKEVATTEATTPTREEAEAEAAARQALEDEMIAALGPKETSTKPSQPCHLPDQFWEARPAFQHIRQAARARMVGPDALLGAALARVALHTDYRIALPPVIGRPASLNIAVGLVGQPGLGKGAAIDTAGDLVPAAGLPADHRVREAPAGSGEGMVGAFFERVVEQDGQRKITVLRLAYEGVAFRVDEVTFLSALKQRSGQTTLEVIRQAWSGEALGGSYASADKQARLQRHSYRLSLVVAAQPEHGRDLLNDDAAGTPQRFLWFAMTDPAAPTPGQEPAWPGPLDWKPPNWEPSDWADENHIDGQRRRFMSIDPTITEQIRQDRHAVLTGRTVNAGDGHRNLSQLKIAGLLAVLDHRLNIQPDDWDLAGMILTTSTAVRETMRSVIAETDKAHEQTSLSKEMRRARARAAGETGYRSDVDRVARVVARHVHRHAVDGAGCALRCVTQAIRSSDRGLLQQALDQAETNQWVVRDENEGFKCGPSKPV